MVCLGFFRFVGFVGSLRCCTGFVSVLEVPSKARLFTITIISSIDTCAKLLRLIVLSDNGIRIVICFRK